MRRYYCLLLILICLFPIWKASASSSSPLSVDVFVSSTCPHCQKAEIFLKQQSSKMPWLQINTYVINQDKVALDTFYQRLKGIDSTDFMVPSLFFCGARWMGFNSAEDSGVELIRALEYCRDHRDAEGNLTEFSQKRLQQMADTSLLAIRMAHQQYSDIQYLFFGIIDAFNFCSLFFLVGFLAILSQEENKGRQLKLGLTLILSLIWMNFIQQNYPDSYLKILQGMRIPAWLAGFCMLMYLLRNRENFRLFLPLVFVFASSIIAYQQSCSSNWAQANASWLSTKELSAAWFHIYQWSYLLFYALPMTILLFAFILFMKTSWIKQRLPRLRKVGYYLVIGISMFLIIYPWALADNYFSIALIPLALWGWYSNRLRRN